jgi:hypothetical protein
MQYTYPDVLTLILSFQSTPRSLEWYSVLSFFEHNFALISDLHVDSFGIVHYVIYTITDEAYVILV